jgi:hypothetical protein
VLLFNHFSIAGRDSLVEDIMQALVQIKNALAHTLTQEEQQLVTAVSAVVILIVIVCRGMAKTSRGALRVGRWMFVSKPEEVKPLGNVAQHAVQMLNTIHAELDKGVLKVSNRGTHLVIDLEGTTPEGKPQPRLTLNNKDLRRKLEPHEIAAILEAAQERQRVVLANRRKQDDLEDVSSMQEALSPDDEGDVEVGPLKPRRNAVVLSAEQLADRRAAAERALNASSTMRRVLEESKNGEGK